MICGLYCKSSTMLQFGAQLIVLSFCKTVLVKATEFVNFVLESNHAQLILIACYRATCWRNALSWVKVYLHVRLQRPILHLAMPFRYKSTFSCKLIAKTYLHVNDPFNVDWLSCELSVLPRGNQPTSQNCREGEK